MLLLLLLLLLSVFFLILILLLLFLLLFLLLPLLLEHLHVEVADPQYIGGGRVLDDAVGRRQHHILAENGAATALLRTRLRAQVNCHLQGRKRGKGTEF